MNPRQAGRANQQQAQLRAERYLAPKTVATVYPWALATLAQDFGLERVRRAVARDQQREAE
jgi:hypothetical protein